eukprot:COSAG02_NODE_5481_length_4290_cov_5.084228_3_plen_34_part_00
MQYEVCCLFTSAQVSSLVSHEHYICFDKYNGFG